MYLLYAVWILVPVLSLLLGLTKARMSVLILSLLIVFGAGVLAWLGTTQSIFMEILAIVTVGGSLFVLFLENTFILGFIAVVAYGIGWLVATALRK